MLECEVYAYSTSPHVSQLYTGYSVLARDGEIRLVLKLGGDPSGREGDLVRHVRPNEFNGLFVVVNGDGNGRRVLFYDTKDSSDLYEGAAEMADSYFKRSYSCSTVPERYRHKVFPLGMNYELYVGGFDRRQFMRVLLQCLRDRTPRRLALSVVADAALCFSPRTTNMCCPPRPQLAPRVLFMVRAWDPDDSPPGLPREQREERLSINGTRARCIDLLRREFKASFSGGFAHTRYAIEHFKTQLSASSRDSAQGNYVSLVHRHPICVATSGLHGSIGWKLGEYVAFSKSVVSERLNHSIPGCFEENRNYLGFSTPEQCVEQAAKLLVDKELRRQMMENNWHYYRTHLAPDRLILRTLNTLADRSAGKQSSCREGPVISIPAKCPLDTPKGFV